MSWEEPLLRRVIPHPADLYSHIVSHVNAEKEMLGAYRTAADASPSKALRFLVNLLIEDEMRHHRLFTELAESLKIEEDARKSGQ